MLQQMGSSFAVKAAAAAAAVAAEQKPSNMPVSKILAAV
jgi:hypothetical protein